MIPILLLRSATSMKKQVAIILAVLMSLLVLPIVAIAAMTDIGSLGSDDAVLYTGTASTTNTYTYGFCTFWVAKRREEVGRPIPNNWHDAHDWDDGARKANYLVDHTPGLYSIMQTDDGDLGHVAFVESVDLDGGWKVTEMNVKGWDIQSGRTFKPDQAKKYNFIH
jgi:N-acetylmuramoyl-L-alanine amidase